MRRRKAKLRRVAGGERRTHSSTQDYVRLEWWKDCLRERPYAATASRKLRFRQINRVINDQPPSVVRSKDVRTYLFLTGEDRDTFVEEFHSGFDARAIRHEDA